MMKTIVSTFALTALLAGAVYAQELEPAQNELSAAQVLQKLESAGYTNIHDIERDDNEWEVEATSPNGARVELELDLKDGRILREEADND
jgi:Peptidase propeptide and YPEB domain